MTSENQARFQQQRALLVNQLRAKGIRDQRVLAALEAVPREEFVPEHLHHSAYLDRALPIAACQTISQPYTVAFMCEALQIKPADRILEIGTGSGYGAAVLSRIAHCVYSIERIPELSESAAERLSRLGYDNVQLAIGDGTAGLPEQAPFDGIICTAAGNALPEPYGAQLAQGGRVVIPLGPREGPQQMCRFTRTGNTLHREALGAILIRASDRGIRQPTLRA